MEFRWAVAASAVIIMGWTGLAGTEPTDDPTSVRRTVLFIATPDAGARQHTTGTGFLLADERGVCLITAQHVATSTAPETTVTLLLGDQPTTLKLTDITAMAPAKWTLSDVADLAAIRVRPNPAKPMHVFQRAQILTAADAPMRERPLTVFGFPLGFGVAHFSPVSQTYSRASDIELASTDKFPMPARYYFLDRPSVQGYSGAPVFQLPGPFSRGAGMVVRRDFILVGVVAATFSDNTGGKLGAVVPPKELAALFDRVMSTSDSK